MNREEAERLLQVALADASGRFRAGQWEAVDTLVNRRGRLLVVQRTGWGKSVVYFISTRILRDRGMGPTVIISPLLALMRNQITAAERLNIHAETINSTNKDDWRRITALVLANQVDAVLISPERLANEDFIESVLEPIAGRLGLFVVDEAHCISDWGHDFRPDYMRLVNVLRQMPENLPVIGTTATANDRVIADVQRQLGNLEVIRGPLVRKSLMLQTMRLPDQAARLAWLAEHVPGLPGSGIVYVLTRRDAEVVAGWLQSNGIHAEPYHSAVMHPDFEDTNAFRLHLENSLLENSIKVLVATSALGMGFDKPDLGFVIHYQAPNSVVSYYQQAGRAGRAVETAYCVMMSGREDDDIHTFFRRNAFPDEGAVNRIVRLLAHSDGLSVRELEELANLSNGQLSQALKYLSVQTPSPVVKIKSKWLRTSVRYSMDTERILHLTRQREDEWAEMRGYLDTDRCLMEYLCHALDDRTAGPCGRCSNCLGRPVVADRVDRRTVIEATRHLRRAEMVFTPKVMVAKGAFEYYPFSGRLPEHLRAQEGRILSRWGDAGWGRLVADDKHGGNFSDELVAAVAEMIQRWNPAPLPTWITCVESLSHPDLVPAFTRRLARRLDMHFVKALNKIQKNDQQKFQRNRFHQCRNLDGVFSVDRVRRGEAVFLVDDVIDSGWTMTILAALLLQAGSGPVFPVALASTSTGD